MCRRQKWALFLMILGGSIAGCRVDPNACERSAYTHFIQMLLCRECFSENTSRTCWRRQKPLNRACKKLLTKRSTLCRCLMARFASNSPLLRRLLLIKWFSRLVIFHRAIHRSRTARFTKAIATWLILGRENRLLV